MKIFLIGLQMVIAVFLVICVLLDPSKGSGNMISGNTITVGADKDLNQGLKRTIYMVAALFLLIAGVLGVFLK